MGKVIEITDQNFEEEVLNSDLPTEVDFWASWCDPCMMVAPIYDRLAAEYEGSFKFYKINVDENPQTARAYQIRKIPLQMFFTQGKKRDHILGSASEDIIRSKVEDILNRFSPNKKEQI